MREIFWDVLEINIVVSVVFCFLLLFSNSLRRRYGARWMKLVWVFLAVRLVIPYNFSPSFAKIRLFDFQGVVLAEGEGVHAGGSVADRVIVDGSGSNGEMTGENISDPDGKGKQEVSGLEDQGADVGGNDVPESGMVGVWPNFLAESQGQTEKSNRKMLENVPAQNHIQERIITFIEWLPYLWGGGVLVCLLYCIGGYIGFCINCRKNLKPVTEIRLRKQVISLEKKMTGKANLSLYQGRIAKSPILTGLFEPKLIFPDEMEWKEAELEFVVAHELCHFTQKDLWLKLLMTFGWCIHWFNPLVWKIKKRFFYELEFACDERVLSGCSEEMRETYARMMLSFAGEKRNACAFSTGFGESKKQMKDRIDHMLDSKGRKRGRIGIVVTGIIILMMGFMISCGYKPVKDDSGQGDDRLQKGAENDQQDDLPEDAKDGQQESGLTQTAVPYDPNHEYNEMIRCYGDQVYIAREDGIYRLSKEGEREELIYANSYWARRGMEIYQDSLYFCGSSKSGQQEGHNIHIYRMDLTTYEVEDLFALYSQVYDMLYDITVYDGKLYVTSGYQMGKMGYELDEEGRIYKPLDEEAEDFLFKEDNDYWDLQGKVFNNEVVIGSEEYEELIERTSNMYRGVIDRAACQKMLNGDQVVMKYKDELLSSIYLKKPDGNYEFLCDTVAAYPVLVTDTGVYYPPYESSAIWYVDYETKTQRKIWEEDGRERKEIQLANYDQDYLYFTSQRYLGWDQEGVSVHEVYLMRIPRWEEGKAEKVYRFETGKNLGSLQRKCAVTGGKMFFEDHETIILDPDANGMGPENNGEPSKDGMALRQAVEAFADAYFQNDQEALAAYLADGFAGRVEGYPYPEQAEQIEGLYISGLPEGEAPDGIICNIFYEFSGNVETDDAYSYLSMEIEKTGQGWKILNYGIEE